MKRETRRHREDREAVLAPLAVGGILLICVVAFYLVGTPPPPAVDDRLCPRDTGPAGATVLLLDTSDPLTPKHRAELFRLAGQITSERPGPMGISPQELLAVYELTEDPGQPTRLIEVCRPLKSPTDRNWRDDIRSGRKFAERDWRDFEDALTKGFPEGASDGQPTSPLLETITVLAARHFPGKRGNPNFDVHLIVFSDLLQHSARLSHYGAYPEAEEMPQRARDLLTDMTGARVSLLRLERPKYAKWQTRRHYYWWTKLVREQGGRIEWQDSF